jgi:hypothetical protein
VIAQPAHQPGQPRPQGHDSRPADVHAAP